MGMEKPPSIIDQEEPTIESGSRALDLGHERIEDPEKAFIMAQVENTAHVQADNYTKYLESPDTYTAEERITFSAWKSWGLSPADVEKKGEHNAEAVGEMYDAEKRIQKLEQEGSRFGLFKEAVTGGAKTAAHGLRHVFYENPRLISRYFSAKSPKEVGISGLMGDEQMRGNWNKMTTSAFRFFAAGESLFRLNKKEPREIKFDNFIKTEEIVEKNEKFSIPHFDFKEYPVSDSDSERISAEKPISQAVSEKVFDWVAGQYGQYLKDPNSAPLGFSESFEQMKAKNLKPEDIKKEGTNTGDWLKSLAEWHARLNNLDKDQLENESILNFYDLILRITSEKDGSSVEKARQLITPLIKIYLATKTTRSK